MSKAIIAFTPEGKKGDVSVGETVLDGANRLGVDISAVCGGRGICGKCRVVVESGRELLGPVSSLEFISISDEELRRGYRLACCAALVGIGTVKINVPSQSRVGQQRLLVAGIQTKVPLNPAVRKYTVKLAKPTVASPLSDVEILLNALADQEKLRRVRVGYEALVRLPHSKGREDGVATVTMREGELIWVDPHDSSARNFGLAVDVGSTKLAAYLLDLNTGEVITSASSLNPQIAFGEDIISRITYASSSDNNLKRLQGVVIARINRLLHDMCGQAHVDPNEVVDAVIVGNTVMHHICLGITPEFLGRSPYAPVVRSAVNLQSRNIGLRMCPGAYVHSLPIIAGFVGADAVADVISTQINDLDVPAVLIDIGTNTEIVISDGRKLIACSCASGPAFEGGHIEHGMRAELGAIEEVYIDPYNLEPGYRTVGGAAPRGICGSGIVDAVASMLKCGIIRTDGVIVSDLSSPRIRRRNGVAEYILVHKEDTTMARDIVVTQDDIREIQLAKAAIFTGTSILMSRLGLRAADIEQIFLAGAFGTYVDPLSALTIGLYPEVSVDRIRFVGNAAGSGARMALLSVDVRLKAEEIAEHIEYVELATDKDFQHEFAQAMYFPHKEPSRFPMTAEKLKKRVSRRGPA